MCGNTIIVLLCLDTTSTACTQTRSEGYDAPERMVAGARLGRVYKMELVLGSMWGDKQGTGSDKVRPQRAGEVNSEVASPVTATDCTPAHCTLFGGFRFEPVA